MIIWFIKRIFLTKKDRIYLKEVNNRINNNKIIKRGIKIDNEGIYYKTI